MNKTVWPVLLLVAGVVVLIDALLPGRLPIFRMLLAVALFWLGITFLGGGNHARSVRREDNAFCSKYIDLATGEALDSEMEIHSAFSSIRVRLPVDYNITIRVSGAFCSATLPDAQNVSFGETECACGTQDPAAPKLAIRAACAFGSMRFFF